MTSNLRIKLILGVVVFSSIYASASASESESFLAQQHGQWNSRIVTDGKRIVFRALVSESTDSEIRVFKFDRNSADCTSSYPELIISRNKRNTNDLTAELFGQVRIDEYPIRNALYGFIAAKDDSHFFITLKNWDRSETFFKELTSGTTIRMKMTAEGTDYFYRFSLNGASQALARTQELCKKGSTVPSKQRRDEDYFKSTRSQSDSDYFK